VCESYGVSVAGVTITPGQNSVCFYIIICQYLCTTSVKNFTTVFYDQGLFPTDLTLPYQRGNYGNLRTEIFICKPLHQNHLHYHQNQFSSSKFDQLIVKILSSSIISCSIVLKAIKINSGALCFSFIKTFKMIEDGVTTPPKIKILVFVTTPTEKRLPVN